MFPRALRRDIIALIFIKAVGLIVIYFAFVAPLAPPEPDGDTMVAHLLYGNRN